ncbi:hypothetical protein RJV04_005006 [Salmonella enterica]|nr:hypothetical protein [Salmonella enterica]
MTYCRLINCISSLRGVYSADWVLEGDIKGCFDNISHDWLLSNISMDKEVLRKWLKAVFMETGAYFQTEAGTPQGGLCSVEHNPPLRYSFADSAEKPGINVTRFDHSP